jgi:hypothetical protein
MYPSLARDCEELRRLSDTCMSRLGENYVGVDGLSTCARLLKKLKLRNRSKISNPSCGNCKSDVGSFSFGVNTNATNEYKEQFLGSIISDQS